jgi:prevent-host-death family protein
MTRRHSIAEARHHLPYLVREAEAGSAVQITRHGKLVAVLIGREVYDRLTSSRRSFGDAYADFLREVDVPSLEIDPDDVFGPARDRSPGRDVPL